MIRKCAITWKQPKKDKQKQRYTSTRWKSKTRVTGSNPRVTSSNAPVRRLKAQVARLKARVRRLKAQVRRLKVRVEAIKPQVIQHQMKLPTRQQDVVATS